MSGLGALQNRGKPGAINGQWKFEFKERVQGVSKFYIKKVADNTVLTRDTKIILEVISANKKQKQLWIKGEENKKGYFQLHPADGKRQALTITNRGGDLPLKVAGILLKLHLSSKTMMVYQSI